MLIDQATGRYQCDTCDKALDFTQVWVIGHLTDQKDVCWVCLHTACQAFISAVEYSK